MPAPSPQPLKLTPEWTQAAVMSTWRPSTIGSGWYPRLSEDARYLICGYGSVHAADLVTGTERALMPSRGFHGNWIRPGVFTLTQEIVDNSQSRRYEGSISDWVLHATADDTSLVHGSIFGADSGNWATWVGGIGRLVWNGQVVMASGSGGALSISENWMATAISVNGEYRGVRVWLDGQVLREHPLMIRGEAHQININGGYVAYGGYGPIHGILPDGTDIDLTVTPWNWEATPYIFFVKGQPWLATVSFSHSLQRGYTLIRPFGEKGVIVLDEGVTGSHVDTDAIWVHVVEKDGVLTVATNDPKGRLQVRKIPITAPRHILLPP